MSQIITIDDFSGYLDKTLRPAVAQQVVDAVNGYIERRSGRSFGEAQTAVERHDLKPTVYLRHQDVQSVESIIVGLPGQNQYVLNAAAYYFDRLGWVRIGTYSYPSYRGYSRRDLLEITYTYGTDDVPEDL